MKTKLFSLFVALICATQIFAYDFKVGGIYYNKLGGDSVEVTYGSYNNGYYNVNGDEYTNSVTIPETVSYNSTTYRVTAIGNSALRDCSRLTSLTIPNSVTSIGSYAFDGCSELTSVTILNENVVIDDYAFANCPNISANRFDNAKYMTVGTNKYHTLLSAKDTIITSCYIHPNTQRISDEAFKNCVNLTSISIPESVTTIGGSAFRGCTGLTSVTIPESITTIDYSVFSGCSGLTSVTIPNSVTTIDNNAFSYCSGLTSVTIGNSVTTIGRYAFYRCSGLTSVTIGKGITSIDLGAFYGCSGLTKTNYTGDIASWCAIEFEYEPDNDNNYHYYYTCNPIYYSQNLYLNDVEVKNLIIPEGVDTINNAAFYGCTGLTSVTIPNSVTTIGEDAFGACSGLTSVTIPNSVTTIGGGAFSDCSGLTSVTIPNSVTTIGDYAFYHCSGLTSVTIPNSVTTIGSYAFYGCSGLTSITIPNSVTTIGSSAFYYCSGLTSVTIPNSVTTIGEGAFYGCSGLTSVTIPNSITTIGDDTFYWCSGLTSVTIPNSVTTIGSSAFYYCSGLTSVTIPNSVTTIGGSAFRGCSGLTSVTIPESVTTIGGSAFRGCSGLTSVTIPESVTTISSSAFYDCSELTSVTIPNSVTTIGRYAFYGCSGLTSVTIGKSITSIGNYAFDGCLGLTSVTWNAKNYADFTSSNTPFYYYKSGGDSNFDLRQQIKTFVFGENVEHIPGYLCEEMTNLTSIAIPNSVTTIGDRAFNHTGLRYLILPNSLTSIGRSAFAYCTTISAIKIEATEPPSCDWGYYYSSYFRNFYGLSAETPIFVPCGSLDAYTASSWANYFDNFVESDMLFVAQSEDETKGEVVVMLNPTCDDQMAMMRVVPKEGYKFVAWNDGNTEAMRTIEAVTEDVIYTARFAAIDGSDAPTAQDSVNVEVTNNTAGFTWQPNEDAYTYSLGVFNDTEMTDTVCKMTFDAAGNMLTKEMVEPQYAPRRKAQQEVSAMNFVVTDLEEGTTYTYMLRSHDCNNMIIETEIGTFQTASASVTEIIDIVSEKSDSVQKIFKNGTIYILRNGEKYTIDGRKVE